MPDIILHCFRYIACYKTNLFEPLDVILNIVFLVGIFKADSYNEIIFIVLTIWIFRIVIIFLLVLTERNK